MPPLKQPARSKATLGDCSMSFDSVWICIPNDVRCTPLRSSIKSCWRTFLFYWVYNDCTFYFDHWIYVHGLLVSLIFCLFQISNVYKKWQFISAFLLFSYFNPCVLCLSVLSLIHDWLIFIQCFFLFAFCLVDWHMVYFNHYFASCKVLFNQLVF